MKSNRFVSIVIAASFSLLLQHPAAAQTLYKSHMPDGRLIFGDRPVPGAISVEKTEQDTSKGGLGVPTLREQDALQRLEKDRLQRSSRQNRVDAAELSLKLAETTRAEGEEPREGERITFRIGGGVYRSRLTEEYFERQRKLEESVNGARRELEQAGRAR